MTSTPVVEEFRGHRVTIRVVEDCALTIRSFRIATVRRAVRVHSPEDFIRLTNVDGSVDVFTFMQELADQTPRFLSME